jgi:hypothetical protein
MQAITPKPSQEILLTRPMPLSIAAALPRGSVSEARPISELQDEADRAQSFKDIDPLFPKRISDAASKMA